MTLNSIISIRFKNVVTKDDCLYIFFCNAILRVSRSSNRIQGSKNRLLAAKRATYTDMTETCNMMRQT